MPPSTPTKAKNFFPSDNAGTKAVHGWHDRDVLTGKFTETKLCTVYVVHVRYLREL